MWLVGWFGGEQHTYCERLTHRRSGYVVRRERAWRLMVPMSAQRNSYRAAGGAGISAGLNRHYGVMGVGFARHGYRCYRA